MTALSPEVGREAERLLRQELEASRRLAELLEQENQALRKSEAEALEHILSAKEALLKELDDRVDRHGHILRRLGLPLGRAGTERLAHLAGETCVAVWEALRETADRCREMNAANGGLLALTEVRVRQSLEVLRGRPDPAKTYGRGGQTRYSTHSHRIGEA